MDANLAKNVSKRFLDGVFDTLNSLLGIEFSYESGAPEAGDAESMAGWSADYPVCLHAQVDGGGAVALLWKHEGIGPLVAQVGGDDPAKKLSVSVEDSAMLQELCDAVVGGGASALGDTLKTVVTLESSGHRVDGTADDLAEALGADLVGVGFSLTGGSLGPAEGMFVFSGDLERRVKAATAGPGEALVSDEEVRDILKDFTPESDADHGGGRNGEAMPENLEVVLDIELIATARLGKVEVPIAEVLNYGPGSIIELGHVVDEPIELLVNGKLIARGDVVVVDERFGLRITEIVSPRERIESLR